MKLSLTKPTVKEDRHHKSSFVGQCLQATLLEPYGTCCTFLKKTFYEIARAEMVKMKLTIIDNSESSIELGT